MGKNKLKKFAEMKDFNCVVEVSRSELIKDDFELKGNWNEKKFHSNFPLVLELGCGKGEYTVGLAKRNRETNYIGIDIKGARIYTGAKTVETEKIPNAVFVRTEIDLLPFVFGAGEVSELWITFPDPQMKKVNKRLTSTRFLGLYRKVMGAEGVVNLKTDSPFMFEYTRRLARENGLEILRESSDIYGEAGFEDLGEIKTHYECQWLSRGKKIKFISFRIGDRELREPDVEDLEKDDYTAMPRFNAEEFLIHNSKA